MAVSVKITGIKSTFSGLDSELTKLVNQSQRISAFQASVDLGNVTPVDTGRARGSWMVSQSKTFRDIGGSAGEQNVFAVLGPVPTNKIETLYITNGTPYIDDLNAGSSEQAPPRFIEKTLSKYFKVSGNSVRITK